MAKDTSIRALTLLGFALIGGCVTTPVVWTKPGVDEGDVAVDASHCRDLVVDEGWWASWEATWPPRFYDPLFMPPYYAWPRPFWYEFPLSLEREQALFEFCMHSKGYRLQALPE